MTMKKWEKKVLKAPGAARRVAEIEQELRLAAGLAVLREEAGLSQRALAKRIGVTQPRVAAIEQSRNVTIDVLQTYVESLGGSLEVTAVKGKKKIPLLVSRKGVASAHPATRAPKVAAAKKAASSGSRRKARRTV